MPYTDMPQHWIAMINSGEAPPSTIPENVRRAIKDKFRLAF